MPPTMNQSGALRHSSAHRAAVRRNAGRLWDRWEVSVSGAFRDEWPTIQPPAIIREVGLVEFGAGLRLLVDAPRSADLTATIQAGVNLTFKRRHRINPPQKPDEERRFGEHQYARAMSSAAKFTPRSRPCT
jgi:hypothetical protein